MYSVEKPSQSNVRPIENWGVVVQLGTEAGSPTKRLVPASIDSLTKVEGCLPLALSGLEAIAHGEYGEHGYGTVSPEEASIIRFLLPSLVEN